MIWAVIPLTSGVDMNKDLAMSYHMSHEVMYYQYKLLMGIKIQIDYLLVMLCWMQNIKRFFI